MFQFHFLQFDFDLYADFVKVCFVLKVFCLVSKMLKRKAMSIEEKAHIIWRLESGEKNSDLCKELSVSHSTISTIWKNKEKIKEVFEKDNSFSFKKIRSTEYKALDSALLKWFKLQRNSNVSISGPILLTKAEEFATRLGIVDFKPNPSWIQRFRNRHNIVFGKVSGESAAVSTAVTETWLNTVWPTLRDGYSDEEIYNADETGLFYKLTPDRTFKFKGEKCSGGKLSKERITLLVAANMTGTVKKQLVVIGKSKRPRCFKNIKTLPVQYENNQKAWMTSELFEKILHSWDAALRMKGKKILLLVDNCPAHPDLQSLRCIKLVFLPPNTTSVMQPLDQGVIRSLKVHFRKLLVLKMIDNIESKKETNVSLLDAVIMASKAWERVTDVTISNCFKHAGFLSNVFLPNTENETNFSDWMNELDLPEAFKMSDYNDFIIADNEVETASSLTSDEIIASAVGPTGCPVDENDDNEEDEEEKSLPTVTEAVAAFSTIHDFFLQDGISTDIANALDVIEKKIETAVFNKHSRKKQSKITDFF